MLADGDLSQQSLASAESTDDPCQPSSLFDSSLHLCRRFSLAGQFSEGHMRTVSESCEDVHKARKREGSQPAEVVRVRGSGVLSNMPRRGAETSKMCASAELSPIIRPHLHLSTIQFL